MTDRKDIIINLNSLSNENFSIISNKLFKIIGKDNYSTFLEIFFNKTINNSEVLFINLYTRLISELLKYQLKNDIDQFKIFYHTLINHCQTILTEEINDDNYEKIINSAALIGNFINKGIIKKELLQMIINNLIKDNEPKKINVMIKLINSISDNNQILSRDSMNKIQQIKITYNSNSRIYILLDDIVDKYI